MEILSDSDRDSDAGLVWDFFGRRTVGFFIDVGANEPIRGSQTWLLEQKGWEGTLIEPNPELCKALRRQRTKCRVVEAAMCAPEEVGGADLHLGVSSGHSSVCPTHEHALTGQVVRVKMQTLDSVVESLGVRQIDFVSIDVEGLELHVLKGFNLKRWLPSLILLEDHFYNYRLHQHMVEQGYKLVRRTGYNNWYVPSFMPISMFSASTFGQLIRLFKKMWLNTPFNRLRRFVLKVAGQSKR
jgi:FkbM family methyltransferase